MTDSQDPVTPQPPPAAPDPELNDLFRAPEPNRFEAPEPEGFIATQDDALQAPEPLIGTEPLPALSALQGGVSGVPGLPDAAAVALLPSGLPVEGPTVAGRIAEEVVAWLKTLASAAVYATLIVTFGFQVARVEGQSMAPTLADQDRLIVNKAAYRFFEEPQIGDIVMLYYPLNPDKSFVKRVIAKEGDQVRIVDGRVYRNDVLINDDYVPTDYRSHDDWGPEVVPEGQYFVMGDHRNNSSDSRHWKWVPKKYIIGKVQLRWWPLPHARLF
jgi:signal peptidase I